MRKFSGFGLFLAIAGLLTAGQASAYQQFTTYRIAGKDIVSIAEQEPAGEDPATLTLKMGTDSSEIVIESDDDLKACKEKLEAIRGSAAHYAEIVVDVNAMTMNGVMVIQCSTFYGLFGDGS